MSTLTTAQVALLAGCSEARVRLAARRGELRAFVISDIRGKPFRFMRPDAEAWAGALLCTQCHRRAIRDGLCGVHSPPPTTRAEAIRLGSSSAPMSRILRIARRGQAEYRAFALVGVEGSGVVARVIVGRLRLSCWEVALCEITEGDGGRWRVASPTLGCAAHPSAPDVVEYLRRNLPAREAHA